MFLGYGYTVNWKCKPNHKSCCFQRRVFNGSIEKVRKKERKKRKKGWSTVVKTIGVVVTHCFLCCFCSCFRCCGGGGGCKDGKTNGKEDGLRVMDVNFFIVKQQHKMQYEQWKLT